MTMEASFNASESERRWYQQWEANGYFAPQGDGAPYCIMIPPPNVTGSLHMGHAFQDTIMDALIRYQRMQGKKTLWQVGTDHAGIATQMVVERQLAAQGLNRHDLGRDEFIKKVWDWKAISGGTITQQLRRMGASVDWTRERFTMDEGLSNAVQEVFVRLYEDGLIYRGKRLVNWDPKLHTAISDLEVISEEENSSMWHFKYFLEDGSTHLVVATTRPETLLGDTAVAVHPEDERYQHLIGKNIRLPITGRLVPIVADTYVDKAFGTGCVKITPAHDFNDFQLGKRHELPLINIFDKDANVLAHFEVMAANTFALLSTETAPTDYAGLERFVARKKLVKQAQEEGWLEKIEPYKLKAPRGDRSGVIVEPWLTDQWYVSAKELAKPAIEAVEDGRIKFVPEQYQNMYFSWMRDIQDWCISRQLWWGHRIPAWYNVATGEVYVGRNEAEVRAKHQLGADITLKQDDDVLDTWFSSALWTFSTLGWPNDTEELRTFHPTDVLVTGFDIIFFWVARMVMMTMHFMKNPDGSSQVPFKTVYVTGLIRDEQGQKMSKSKGNVIDPIDMIDGIGLDSLLEKRTSGMMQPDKAAAIAKRTQQQFPEGINAHGTDALRFTLAALASTGRDINWDMRRLEGYRNFCNKLWNAARFVLSNCEGHDVAVNHDNVELSVADEWIISRLQRAELQVTEAFNSYRFDQAAQAIYEFVWNEYCDWYLELSKPVLNGDSSPAAKAGTRRTLLRVLEAMLRLMHPIMPYISEEIWQRVKVLVGKTGESIMLEAYPVADNSKINLEAEADVEWLKSVIAGIRNIRGEMNISPSKQLPVLFHNSSATDQLRLQRYSSQLRFLARLESIDVLAIDADLPPAATALVGNMAVLVPLKGFIDKDAEAARLSKEIDRLDKEVARIGGKLSNESFTAKAPAAVIAQEQTRLADAKTAQAKLQEQLEKLKNL